VTHQITPVVKGIQSNTISFLMLQILIMFIDWFLLSSFWIIPSSLAREVTDYVTYPFTSSVAATNTIFMTSKQKKKIQLASRSVKSLARGTLMSTLSLDVDPALESDVSSSPSSTVIVPTAKRYDYYPIASELSTKEGKAQDFEELLQENVQKLPSEFGSSQTDSKQHPVHYRYFSKSRSRLRNRDSIPFILLGPSVDHWKLVGQNLASRGFSVMAVSLEDYDNHPNDPSSSDMHHKLKHEPVVEAILDALRWNRVILVGCDGDAALLALRAASRLAPQGRVAGLLLCGDLSDVQRQLGDVDSFLDRNLACPCSVIWDGDHSVMPVAEDTLAEIHRCLIRGGGTAPHRRLPEQFAWALTRFVEEKLAPSRNFLAEVSKVLPERNSSRQLITPGSLLVAGRLLAEVLFFVSAMKVVTYQYENIYDGLLRINNGYKALSVWPRRTLKLVGELLLAWSGLKSKTRKRMDELPIEAVAIPQGMDDPEDRSAGEQVEKAIEPPESVQPSPYRTRNEELSWPIPLINPVTV
jgi:hypothetical protein